MEILKTIDGYASFLSSYIAILPLVSPMYVLGLHTRSNYSTSNAPRVPATAYRRGGWTLQYEAGSYRQHPCLQGQTSSVHCCFANQHTTAWQRLHLCWSS